MSQKVRGGGRADKPAFGNQIRFAVDTVRELIDYLKTRHGDDSDRNAGSRSPTTPTR